MNRIEIIQFMWLFFLTLGVLILFLHDKLHSVATKHQIEFNEITASRISGLRDARNLIAEFEKG